MAYLTAAEFRPGTLSAATAGLELAEDLAPTADLTSQIATVGARVDYLTGDHFEQTTGSIEVDVTENSSRLFLPQRFSTITAVKTRDHLGVLTTQTAGVYRLRSSLDAAGAIPLYDRDYVEILDYGNGLYGPDVLWPFAWPVGTSTVQITGTYGWTVTPGDIKRVVALLVWDHFERESGDVRRAKIWRRGDLTVERDDESTTGIPEADDLLKPFMRSGGEGPDDLLVLVG